MNRYLRTGMRASRSARMLTVSLFAVVSPTALLAQTYLNATYQPIAWQAGSQLVISPANTAVGNQTEMRLDYDAVLGVRLQELRNQVAGSQLRAFPGDPGGLGQESGLWRVRVLPTPIPAGSSPTSIAPNASVQVFTVGGTNTTTSAVLVWTGLALPSSTEQLSVEMKLSSASRVTTDSVVTAEILCRRSTPTPGSVAYLLESVDLQITLQEEAPQTTNSHARVLVPVHYSVAVPVNNIPLPFMAFRSSREAQSWSHPGLHEVQFAGFHQPDFPSSVYLGTEDFRGFRKFFRYWNAPLDESRFALAWRSRYVPEHDRDPSNDGFVAPYPTVVHTLANPEASWWYDIAAFYRDTIKSQPAGPDNNIVTATAGGPGSVLNPVAADNCVAMLASHIGATGASPYTRVFDEVRAVQRLLNPSNTSDVPAFLQLQQWMKGDPNPPISHAPMGPDTMPDASGGNPAFGPHPALQTSIATARANDNISTTLYAFPGLFRITSNWPQVDPIYASWLRQPNVDINWFPTFPAPQARLDFGKTTPTAPSWVADWFANTVLNDTFNQVPSMRGIYLDALAGAGPLPRYPELPGFPVIAGPFHGGAIGQEGRIEALDLSRTRLASNIGTTPTSQHPEIPVVFGEFIEEYLAGHMDLCQRGLRLYPGQGMLASPPSNGTNFQAQDMLPPTWSFVYHESAPAHAAGLQLTLTAYNAMVERNTQPATAVSDYLDMFAYAHGLMLVNGSNPLVFSHDTLNPVGDRMFDHTSASGYGPSVAGNANKLQIVTSVQNMMRGFYACRAPGLAGAPLTKGRRERPLRENHGATIGGGAFAIDRGYSPMTRIWDWMRAHAATYTDPLPVEFVPFTSQSLDKAGSTTGTFLTSAGNFPAGIGDSPKVVHSVWSHPSQPNKLTLVFWNWSGSQARWEGVFDPTIYGLNGAAYTVNTIDATNGMSMTQGTYSGTKTLVFDVATGGQIGLSALPSTGGSNGGKLPSRAPHIVEVTW